MDEGDGVSDSQLQQEIAARDAEVTQLLGRKSKPQALAAALRNPPIATKSVEIKVRTAR
jgi:hypothetical protein